MKLQLSLPLPALLLAARAHRQAIPADHDAAGIGRHHAPSESVRPGPTPPRALRSATLRHGCFLHRADDTADIATGKLLANSRQDIAAARSIHPVARRATSLDRAALDAMLAATRARVAAREAKDP